MKKYLWIGVIIVIALIGWVVIKKDVAPATGEPIKVGFVGSLTGDLQSWGVESKNAIALAVKEINNDGGIDGQPIEVIYEDAKCDSKMAVSAAQKLITVDKVKVMIGYCSLEVSSIAPLAEQNKVLLFAPEATSPNITTAGDYTFRLAPSDAQPAQLMAKLFAEKYQNVAIITETSDFSGALRTSVTENLKVTPVKVVFNESFTTGTRDFRSLIVKLKQSDADAVFVNSNTSLTAGLIVKQLQDQGVDIPRYGVYWGDNPEFLRTAGSAAEGFLYYNFVANTEDPKVQKFLADYKEMYGEAAPSPQFALLDYDAVYILKDVISKAGYDADKIKAELYKLNNFPTLSGNISFDENGDSQGFGFNLFEVKSGKPVLLQ